MRTHELGREWESAAQTTSMLQAKAYSFNFDMFQVGTNHVNRGIVFINQLTPEL